MLSSAEAVFQIQSRPSPGALPCSLGRIARVLRSLALQGRFARGAILTINTAGDFLGWQPHIHGIVTCGGFLPNGEFEPAPAVDAKTVREVFEAKVFSMLGEKGLINHGIVDKITSWKHTGFDAWIGPPIPDIKEIVHIGMYTVREPAASSSMASIRSRPPSQRTRRHPQIGRRHRSTHSI